MKNSNFFINNNYIFILVKFYLKFDKIYVGDIMFENKKKLKEEVLKLKSILDLSFSLNNLKKNDLKIIKKILEDEISKNKKIKLNNYYDSILTQVKNPNPNGLITNFGYTYNLPNTNRKIYNNLIICVKYKNSDEWINIYEYVKEKQIDLESKEKIEFNIYENILNSKYLNLKERNCIENFINRDKCAINIYQEYLNHIISPELIYTDIKNKKR